MTDSAEGASFRERHRRHAIFGAVFVVALSLGLALHFGIERARSQGRVLRGVTVLGVPFSGLGEAEARRELETLVPRVRELRTRVMVRGRPFEVSASDVGLDLDVSSTAHAALSAGREGSWLAQLGWWIARLISPEAIAIASRVDASRSEAFFGSLERPALGQPYSEGTIAYAHQLVPTYPREGFEIDRKEARAIVQHALSTPMEGTVVELTVRQRKPLLGRGSVDKALAEAGRWLAAPVEFISQSAERSLSFDAAAIGRAIRTRVVEKPAPHLELSLDDGEIDRVIAAARSAFERPAKDARFSVDPGGGVRVEPSELGTRLDDAAIRRSLRALLDKGERRGTLAFLTDVQPKLTTERAEALGVKGLVARFTTFFPCCEARVKNIERIAALVDGTVVGPGEVFSLNGLVGPRTTENGFVSGPTIVEGEMEMTVGGGVSQFATTLFNAVLDGGYELIQRQPHTYYFPRYPEGHEATVSYPTPDLVFRNDSNAGLLIETEVGKKHVRVLLYGDTGGRKVVRRVSSRFEITEPPLELEPDPALSPAASELQTKGAVGWSVTVSRLITLADGQTKEERRKVVYSPRPRRVSVHPCRIPKGKPGYTGEECPETPDAGTEADAGPS